MTVFEQLNELTIIDLKSIVAPSFEEMVSEIPVRDQRQHKDHAIRGKQLIPNKKQAIEHPVFTEKLLGFFAIDCSV